MKFLGLRALSRNNRVRSMFESRDPAGIEVSGECRRNAVEKRSRDFEGFFDMLFGQAGKRPAIQASAAFGNVSITFMNPTGTFPPCATASVP